MQTEKSQSNSTNSEANNIIDLPVTTSEIPPIDLKVLSPYAETLEDIINSWNLDEPLNAEGLDEASPEIKFDTYLWIIRQKEKELAKYKSISEESINRTQLWLERKEKNFNSTISFLSNQIRYYLKSNGIKSLSLPNGTIGLRKKPDTLEIVDEELFYENAKVEFLRHTPESYEPDLKAIKDYIKQTSELPKGVILKSQEPKFYYKLTGD
ncbi:MAG: host-nuclease inhibitor Gam family protein [Ignavibacteria bacterium]|nr:host-nuclease inhibitor Gam family protein [Ignavibacteria bacterium]